MENVVTSVSVKTTWQEIWSVFVSFTQSAPDWLGGIQDQSPRCNTALYIGIHKYSYYSKRWNTDIQSATVSKTKLLWVGTWWGGKRWGEMREMQKVELTLDLPRAAEQATQASPLSNISPILVFNIILIIIAMIIMIRIRASSSNHVESRSQLVSATRPSSTNSGQDYNDQW